MFLWFFSRKPSRRVEAQQSQQASRVALAASMGRRRRDDVPYAMPKDLEEGQRLNLQHYIFRYFLRGNYVAPLPSTVSSILDVGSGTGIWGQEMAAQFPGARVYGLDLEPPQSISLAAQAKRPPPNYHFVQGNLLEGLPFPDAMFDYVHQRLMVAAIPGNDWTRIILDLKRVTRPGGWIELLEMGPEEIPGGEAMNQIRSWMAGVFSSRGMDAYQILRLGDFLRGAGLHGVTQRPLNIPIGSWDRHLGVMMEKDMVAILKALQPLICPREGISEERFESYVKEATREWSRVKATCRFYLAYGQV